MSVAVIDMGLSRDEFFSLTPRQFNALARRHRHRLEREEFLYGQLAAIMVNTSMRAPEKPMSAQDFMPSRWQDAQAVKPKKGRKIRMTKKLQMQVAAKFKAFAAARFAGARNAQ